MNFVWNIYVLYNIFFKETQTQDIKCSYQLKSMPPTPRAVSILESE